MADDSNSFNQQTAFPLEVVQFYLAALCFLLYKNLNEANPQLILVESTESFFPVCFQLDGQKSFQNLLDLTEAKIKKGHKHKLFAFQILASPLLEKKHALASPQFRFALINGLQAGQEPAALLRAYPHIFANVVCFFSLNSVGRQTEIQCLYSAAKYTPRIISQYLASFSGIVEQCRVKPDLKMSEMQNVHQHDILNSKLAALTHADFNF